MIVTDLVPKGKRQVVVWIDGEPSGILENREVSGYRLEAGTELEPVQWEKIVNEAILPRGKRKALELLEVHDRTTKELHDKMLSSGFTEAQTWDIIAYVMSFHYIDEERYAVSYFSRHASAKSFREMQQTLLRKGVAQETIDSAYRKYRAEAEDAKGREDSADDGEPDDDRHGNEVELSAVRRFVEKRLRGKTITRAERDKVYAGLIRKGFDYAAIQKVFSEYTVVGDGAEETEW